MAYPDTILTSSSGIRGIMPKRKSGSKTKGGGTIAKSSNDVKRAADNQSRSNLQFGVAGLIALVVALIGNRLVDNSSDNSEVALVICRFFFRADPVFTLPS